MRLRFWQFIFLLATAASSGFGADIAWEPTVEGTALARPQTAEEKADQQKQLERVLERLKSRGKAEPQGLVVTGGFYVLRGDLFKNGGRFALLEFPDGFSPPGKQMALVEWAREKWQVRGVWELEPVWRPKGWRYSEEDPLPVTPATRPFELRDFSGDGVPEVLVASEVDRYHQAYCLLRFNPKTRGLDLLTSSFGKPTKSGGYVRVFRDSGRKIIFDEWTFLQWSERKLRRAVTWHEESMPEHEFTVAVIEHRDGTKDQYGLTLFDGETNDKTSYRITKNGELYVGFGVTWSKRVVALEHFDPRDPRDPRTGFYPWLFEKLTGLAPSLLPDSKEKRSTRFEEIATVEVAGDDRVKRKFSVKKNR